MTAPDFDEPRMIYTGPLPPHLLRAREAPEEPSFDSPDEPERNAPLLAISAAAAVALVTGIAIGALLPPLLHPQQVQAHRLPPSAPTAAPVIQAAAEPVVPASPEPAIVAPVESPVAPQTPAVAPRPRAAVAILASQHAAAPAREKPGKPEGTACANRGGAADRTVCADPVVATADRELQQAYQHAKAAGTPAASLRADEIDWLLFRDSAARRSPADLALAYRQRIDQVNNLADEPPH